MKSLFTSALLTAVAVPFLMAAPTAQNTTAMPAPATTPAKSKVQKKSAKKAVVSKTAPAATPASAK